MRFRTQFHINITKREKSTLPGMPGPLNFPVFKFAISIPQKSAAHPDLKSEFF